MLTELKIKSIKKLPEKHHVYDLTVYDTHNFFISKSCILTSNCDGMSHTSGTGSSAQQALRNIMEEFSKYSRFILTANYAHKIIEPIMSRVQTFYICPDAKDYTKRCLEVLKAEKIILPAEQKPALLKIIDGYYPDLRKSINELQKYSITGTFKPPEHNTDQDILKIANICFEMLRKSEGITTIRRYIIESEKLFRADYQLLLKNMFEVAYNSDLEQLKMRNVLLLISEGLYYHQVVLDKEINFFATCIKIGKVI